jgi:hypothetical protein
MLSPPWGEMTVPVTVTANQAGGQSGEASIPSIVRPEGPGKWVARRRTAQLHCTALHRIALH